MSNHNKIAPRERLYPVRDLYSNAVAGRAKYKFASFWNRNHAHRALQRAHKNFATMQAVAKQVYTVHTPPPPPNSPFSVENLLLKFNDSTVGISETFIGITSKKHPLCEVQTFDNSMDLSVMKELRNWIVLAVSCENLNGERESRCQGTDLLRSQTCRSNKCPQ